MSQPFVKYKEAAAHGHALSAPEHSNKAKVNLSLCLNTTL